MRLSLRPIERTGLVLPALLLAALLATMGVEAGMLRWPGSHDASLAPPIVTVAPHAVHYRGTGGFLAAGKVVDAPLLVATPAAPLAIMRNDVTIGDYARCVADGACRPAAPRPGARDIDRPVTGVSYDDAIAYAEWLSDRTGAKWRLPSVVEWTMAAGTRAPDDGPSLAGSSDNPARRWLADYEREAALDRPGGALPLPIRLGGSNEFGVEDLAGAVWDWTSSCDGRTTLNAAGRITASHEACGAHYLMGRHRTIMTNFVRDAASGGCSTGLPPDNLGFRLVRDPGPIESLVTGLRAILNI